MTERIIVVGGVAAGMSAASKARRIDPKVEITVYEAGDQVSYGACGLPYFISNLNNDYKKMIIRTADDFIHKQNIDVKLKHKVVKVFPKDKSLLVRNILSGQVFIDHYDKLIIATGAAPIMPPWPGRELKNVFTLKTIQDAIDIKEAVMQRDVKNVAIIGAGYIGMELVESMIYLGKKVTVIDRSPRVMNTFDKEISDLVLKESEKHNVAIYNNETVEALIGSHRVEGIKTDRAVYEADAVVVCVGVKPSTELMKGTGVKLFPNDAIVVDQELKTNLEDIYAAGDCATIYHQVLKKDSYIPLGTNANKQGKVLGENILGSHKKFPGVIGTAVCKVLDITIARTGISEEEAQHHHIPYKTHFVKASSHASYYPEATPIYVKLIYDPVTRKLLGAQMAGEKGIAIRIDVFATAIQNQMVLEDIGMLDLCYAPPFATVWDAIQVAANSAK
ncbi:NADPH-dependent 2,4-dienoyl-CoA reductase, sulfur reductase [Natronincola peptidivorans]|uniref:NADPH-dependent 2,4-dienoyl-CoA reductase, sulfur reductase n=1 Tax=Natronincola peptidivorans TaxID=426128 RepID=A0A1I0D0B0_9FIRM|nr:CoA-disulfide reductase [Natronincola peptidivorans]SET24846.1 NADPH-dependent 2,4-dienoyl-CoA reductase, sulfur reductase [Natronincola peptidivorans]